MADTRGIGSHVAVGVAAFAVALAWFGGRGGIPRPLPAMQAPRPPAPVPAEPVLRVGNLEARRDFLDVRDVVRAYRLLLDHGEAGEPYNVCSGEAHPLRDLVDQMIDISGLDVRVDVEADRVRAVDVPLLQGDARRMRALGWKPEITLRQTLAELLAAAGVAVPATSDAK